MSLSLFIDDGYTCTKTLDPAPGLFPKVEVVYRPGLSKARTELSIVSGSNNPTRIEETEAEIVSKHVVSLNGEPLTKEQALKLKPALRVNLLNLVLGYIGSDEEKADLKN